jgi:hypothetical protein
VFQNPSLAYQVHPEAIQPVQACQSRWLPTVIAPLQHIALAESFCNFETNVSYSLNSTGANAASTYNISFSMDGLAEVSPGGQIVQYSNFSWIAPAFDFWNNTGGVGNDGKNATANVTAASGAWTPSGIANIGIHQTGPMIGRISIQRVFHFQISPAKPDTLKFDVDFSDWPWKSTTDHLGLLFGAAAEPGAHFAWNSASQNLTEESNSGGSPIVGLQLGSSASTFGTSQGPSSVMVSCNAGLYPADTPAQDANLLINFTGGYSGYVSLHYDPWIIFSPQTSSSGTTSLIDLTAILVIVAGSAAAVILGVVALRARKTAPETGMRSFA